MNFFKRTLPIVIAFVVGLFFAIQDYIPTTWSKEFGSDGANFDKILLGIAFVLGLYSLCHLHWTRIRRGNPGYGYSVIVYVALFATLFVGFAGEAQTLFEMVTKRSATFASFQTYDDEGVGAGFNWIYNYLYNPSASTMFSILAFFIASAAYRTFRAKTWEATMLLVAAVLVMFGCVPISDMVSPKFPLIADWIMSFPNMAAKRGILLGVSLGAIATALRIIFGIERAYLGGD